MELVANVYHMPTNALIVYEYKTEMVSGKAGFKSTLSGAGYYGHIESSVCATEAEAEENAACRLYKKLVGHH